MGWLILPALALLVAWVAWRLKVEQASKDVAIDLRWRADPAPTLEEDNRDRREEKDAWEPFEYWNADVREALGKYRIAYVDQNGLCTTRQIDIKRVHGLDGQYAIDAHCHLRGVHRSFLNKSIQSAVDVDTGEVVEHVAVHAMAKFGSSDMGRALAAIDREWMSVAVLVFIARADGQMRAAERNVIVEYLQRRCSDLALDESATHTALKSVAEPAHRDYSRMLNAARREGKLDVLRDLHECALEIVKTQKTIHPMEQAALTMLINAASG